MWDRIRRNYRRLVAFMLIVVMVATNMGGNLSTVFAAGETESALFLVDGGELRRAIQEAQEQGEVFKFSSLQLAASRKSIKNKYEKLLGTKDGKVYELDLDIDSSYAPEGTAVRVFYNAGTKDVVFLFQNESEMVVDYRVNIDGYELKEVTVNPNSNNIEDEDASFAENYEASDMINDVVDKPKAETVGSKETAEADGDAAVEEPDEGTDGSEEEGTEETAEGSESVGSEEEGTGQAEEPGTDGSESADDEADETVEESESQPESEEEPESELKEEESEEAGEETETEEETEAEAELKEEDADSADGELLGLSRHEAAVVAVSLDDLDEEGLMEETEAEAEEETEEETETEAEEETEEETEAEAEEETEEETEAEAEEETEEETKAQEETNPENTEETESETGTMDGNETDPGDGETQEETTAEETDPSESGEDLEGEADIENGETAESADGSDAAGAEGEDEEGSVDTDGGKSDEIEMEGQALEDDEIEFLGTLEAKPLDTVTILDHVNARAVKVAWEDIEAIIAEEAPVDCLVEYFVNLPEGASVKGAESVAQGENLYFAVEVAEGYEILAVYADGQELEVLEEEVSQASASAWKAGSHVYLVEGVEGDLAVEVEVEEVRLVIPAAEYTAEADDAVFTVNVPEDAFEEEVEFRARKITEEDVLEDLASQADEAIGESRTVAGIVAYDLAFFTASGEETEPSKPVNVSMSFKEEAIPQEMAGEASGISVVHFPEGEDAKTVTTVEETSVEELEFEAESFSTWAAVAVREASINHDGEWIPVKNLKELHSELFEIKGKTEKVKIYLDNDIETNYDQSRPLEGDHGWLISEGTDVVIDLNGHTLTYGGVGTGGKEKSRYLFKVDGTLTIMDSSNGKGIINHNRDIDTAIYLDKGTLNLEGGTITAGDGHTNSHGIEIDSYSAVLNMTGGSIEGNGNENADGGGILLVKGTVNISGGSIKGNTARNGGGICTHSGPVTMTGGSIEGNRAKLNGGGINVGTEMKGSLTFNGGEIKENTAGENGGGIYTHAGTKTVVGSEAKITGNHSERVEPEEKNEANGYYEGFGGGGIFSNGALTIRGGKISGNKSVADGGGVYVDKNWKETGEASFLMTGGEIDHNTAETGEGGGIYFGWDGTIEGGSIFENKTTTEFDWGGGGIFIQTGVAKVKITNVLITDNHADGFGGGVAGCPSGVVEIFTIDGAAIYGNEADGTGMTKRTDEDRKTEDKAAQKEWNELGYTDYQDYYCQNESTVYGKMLGGGSANWKGSSNQKLSDSTYTATKMITIGRYENATATYRMALTAEPDAAGKAYAESSARVRIYGNTSTTHGGGIMSNGHLELGEEGPGHLEISKTVVGGNEAEGEKEWNFTLNLFDPQGNPYSAGGGSADEMDGGMMQGSVGYSIKDEETGELHLGSLSLENGQAVFALKHNQRIIFDDLPEGTIYHVVENEANQDGYTTQVSGSDDSIAVEDEKDATKVIGAEGHIPAQGKTVTVDFINKLTGDLTVSKSVVGEANTQDWEFILTLEDEDGKPLTYLPKETDPVDGAMQAVELAFEKHTQDGVTEGVLPIGEGGQVLFMLRHGESITIKGIPVGTVYKVVEQEANKHGLEVKVLGSEGSTEIKDENDPSKTVGIGGSIPKGQTAEARFINARFGTLSVSKEVVGDEGATGQDWEFELVLTQKSAAEPESGFLPVLPGNEGDLGSGMQLTVLPYEITRTGKDPETGSLAFDAYEKETETGEGKVWEGKASFIIKHGETITIKDIPAGMVYKVSEVKANQDGFTTNIIGSEDGTLIADEANEGKYKGTEGEIFGGQETTVGFINTKTNILTVSKLVKGEEAFSDYEWRFTLELKGMDEGSPDAVDGEMQIPSIAYKGGSLVSGVEAPEDGTLALEGGTAQFVLKHGQFITFVDLPVGITYTVKEDEANSHGFYAKVSGNEGSVEVKDESGSRVVGLSGTIENGKQANVDFINQKGKLTVRKVVRGNEADMSKEFPFTVTLEDKVVNGKHGDMDFTNGVAKFKLKNGDSAEATDLPVGVGYSVEEGDNSDYEVEFSNASGNITVDGVTVTCINTKNGSDTPPGGNNPGGGSPGGGGGSPRGGSPTTDIGEHEVPLANFADAPTETIVESDVPLVPLPKTGDSRHKGMLLMLFGLAGLGALFSAASLKKNKEED